MTAVLFVLLCVFVVLPISPPSLPRAAAQSAEPIREVWRRPLPDVQCLAIAPDGARIAVVTWSGEVLCWERRGRRCWSRFVPGAEAVVLGRGNLAVVYTPLDALHRDLLALDPQGQIIGRATVSGPITTVCPSPNGQAVAVGTMAGTIEVHRWDGKASPVLASVTGAVQQLGYDPGGNLIAATVKPAWLMLLTSRGQVRWRSAAPPAHEFRLAVCPRGIAAARPDRPARERLTVVALVPAEPRFPREGEWDDTDLSVPHGLLSKSRAGRQRDNDQIRLIAYTLQGKPVWRQTLLGRDPHLSLVDENGTLVVAYERADERAALQRYDRWLACFEPDGSQRWQQGGIVFDPLLISASPDGNTILSLCTGNRFWLLSGRGQTLWSYTAAAPIRIARASADGAAVAVATSDGQLALLKISPRLAVRRPETPGTKQELKGKL
jgi:hypothetical protein